MLRKRGLIVDEKEKKEEMEREKKFNEKSKWERLSTSLKYFFDIIAAIALIIPMFTQWIIRQLFYRKKKSINGQLALVKYLQ